MERAHLSKTRSQLKLSYCNNGEKGSEKHPPTPHLFFVEGILNVHIAKQNRIPFILLFILIVTCYSNTFTSSWQFDDTPNILENPSLQIENLAPETIKNTFFASPNSKGSLYRPIACFSFAINWYLGKDNPVGYHIVNLLIHILSSFYLFKTSLILLNLPLFKAYRYQDIYPIALLGTILWAINPIQIQAVTYIVQRMTSLAALFFILALYNYIIARQAGNSSQRVKRFFLCILSFLLALGSKENAITFIPSLLLLEYFFLNQKDKFSKKILISLFVANTCLLLAAVLFIIDHNYLQSIMLPFDNRSFSIAERLFTQPSIILFYLSLLLYPSPERLSIDHSFPLSTSIIHPWTTLPAIFCIVTLLIFSFWRYKKIPLLSFSILFFMINHLVESTIIPLELIFEHRNYLPSIFLFLPIAACFQSFINKLSKSNRAIHTVVIFLIPFLLVPIGIGTFIRNNTWATEEALWTDALSKAPNNARPLAKLGIIYGWKKEKNQKNFKTAIALTHKSVELEYPNASFKSESINNIGKIYANYGFINESIYYFNKSLELNPNLTGARDDLAYALQINGEFNKSLDQINILLENDNCNSKYHNTKTILLLWMNNLNEATNSSIRSLANDNNNIKEYLYNTGICLTRLGYYKKGLWFLNKSFNNNQNDIRVTLSLIENRVLAGDTIEAKKNAYQLLSMQNIAYIKKKLQSLRSDYSAAPVNIDLITPIIIDVSRNIVTDLEEL